MKVSVIVLGVIAGLVLFVAGCTGASVGSVFNPAISSPVGAGILAMLSSLFAIVGGALAYALPTACLVLLSLATILAGIAFLIQWPGYFAFLYLFGAVIATVATALAGLVLREDA